MTHPYREPQVDVELMEEDTPESILVDTLRRLNNVDEEDAQRVVRGLAAFIGFSVGRWERNEEPGYVDEEDATDE